MIFLTASNITPNYLIADHFINAIRELNESYEYYPSDEIDIIFKHIMRIDPTQKEAVVQKTIKFLLSFSKNTFDDQDAVDILEIISEIPFGEQDSILLLTKSFIAQFLKDRKGNFPACEILKTIASFPKETRSASAEKAGKIFCQLFMMPSYEIATLSNQDFLHVLKWAQFGNDKDIDQFLSKKLSSKKSM